MSENGIEINNSGDVETLASFLGWKENDYWIYYEDLTFNLNEAPIGHLPIKLFLTLEVAGYLPKQEPSGKRSQVITFGSIL